MNKQQYMYLHGFASSPNSTKANYLCDRLAEKKIKLEIPDLNQDDFTHLTLTRQLQQVGAIIEKTSTPLTLIGSSFGGLTAALLGQKYPQIQRLILLAPAFNFLSHLSHQLGEVGMQQWEEQKFYPIYHYGEKRSLRLHFQFIVDLREYQQISPEKRSISTTIVHGIDDQVIPIEASREYSKNRHWVKLREVNSDHNLTNVLPEIWEEIYMGGFNSSKTIN